MKRLVGAFCAAFMSGYAYGQTAPIIPNLTSPIAVILIDPTNGQPYKFGQADVSKSAVPIANITSPIGSTLINPITGVPYH